MELATQPGAAPDEVLFLVVQALSQGPFAVLGEQLAAQAAAQGLLPRRHDVAGTQHALGLAELQQRYAHLPPDALQQLLSQLLARRRAEAPQPAARGLTSLLEGGTLSVLSAAASPPPPPSPAWLRPARHLPSQAHRLLLLRQGGLLRSAQHPQTVAPAAEFGRQLAHHLTVRGHRFAVYCVTYDRTGRYIVTGSDDRLVKIWSTRTGLLQSSCRGHDAEITDLSVSADNRLLASSSMDGTVRVWELESESGRPGQPVSVLVGHTGPTSFVDFHPSLPGALLSASFDGTCRIWQARDAAATPIVLRVDTARFGLSGLAVSRLGSLGWQPFAGSRAATATAAVAPSSGLFDARVRTTRNMERQLLHLTRQAAGPSAQQHSRAGVQGGRQSGRAVRQLRDLNEHLDEDEDGDEEEGSRAAAAWQHRGGGGAAAAAAAAAVAADEEDSGHEMVAGTSGLLVCGFSQDGTHIVAGGNDCSVYIWQWLVAGAAGQQAQQQQGTRPGTTPSGPAALLAVAGPASAAASPATSPRQQPWLAASAAAAERAASGEAGTAAAGAAAAAAGTSGTAEHLTPAERLQQVQEPPRQQQVQEPPRQQQVQEPPRQQEQQRRGPSGSNGEEGAMWPAPRELCQLKGHRNDVILLQFSHGGDQVATGSKDGTMRVWRRPRRWRKRPQAWEQEVTFAVLADAEAIKEARRRRRPPPAPSIDQISWSADDQQLVVSVTDFGIRVLAMPEGQLVHHLTIHTSHVHILECHPCDPALALSASYDGTLAVWHMRSGAVLRRFSSRNTRPDGRSWPDVIPFADGHWAPDGCSITITDVAGQLHYFALGSPPCSLLGRAPYDQFFTADYNPLLRDLQHNVVDAEMQLPPHLLEARGALCDALGNPYPELLQQAFNTQHVLSVPAQEAAWLEPGKEPGYLLAAPTLTAAQWAVEQVNGTEHAVQLAIARAQERLTVYEDRLNAGATAAAAHEAAAEAGQLRSRQRREQWAEDAMVVVDDGLEPDSSGEEYAEDSLEGGGAESDEDVDSGMLTSEEEEDEEEEEEGGGEGSSRRLRNQRSSRQRGRVAAEASRHSSRLAGRRAAGGSGAGSSGAPARRGTRAAAVAVEEGSGEEGGDHELREERQRQDREARAARRRAAQQERLAEERHRRQRRAAARRYRAASSDEEAEAQHTGGAGEGGREGVEGPSRHPAAALRTRRRPREEMEEEVEGERGAVEPADGRERKRQRRGNTSGGRALSNYGWLLGTEQTSAWYVPQVGDAVVYLREGHQQYLTGTNDKRPPPWATLRYGRSIRPAEPCRVVDVRYVIANDGTDRTLAQVTLSLTDAASPLKDTCFAVEVPSPAAGYAEFVILRSRFEASVVAKCWEVGEQCQVYWNDDESTGVGEWWLGTIVHDLRGGRNADVLEDAFAVGQLWERFDVRWHGVAGPDGELEEERQADNQRHSPWELYPPGPTDQAVLQEATTLDPELKQRMLAAVQAAGAQDRFVIFVAAPEPDEQYVSKNRRTQHYNRLVALPLSLHELGARLQSGYYRQAEALAGDLATIAANAEAFNGEESELAEDAAALAEYLTAVLQGQDVDAAAYAAFPEDVAAAEEAPAAAAAARGRSGSRRCERQREPQSELAMPDLQLLLQQGMDLPPPPLPVPLPQQGGELSPLSQPLPAQMSPRGALEVAGTAFSAAGTGWAGSSGMRVRFTVPSHLRAPAPAASAAAAGDDAPAPSAAPEAAAGEALDEQQAAMAAVAAASARPTPPLSQWFAEAAGGSATQEAESAAAAPESVPQLPPGLFADVAALLTSTGGGNGNGNDMLAALDPAVAAGGGASAAPPPDWLAALPPSAAAAGASSGSTWPGTSAVQQNGRQCRGPGALQWQQQQQQHGRRSSGRAMQRHSYRESDGEEPEGAGEAAVAAVWAVDNGCARAFQPQQQVPPPRQRRQRKAAPAPAAWGDNEDWIVDVVEEEEASQSGGEDSYQPEDSSSEDSESESGSGRRTRGKQQQQPQRSNRRR